jgi:hypothetical protein
MSSESDGGMTLTGENRRPRRKTCPSATLSTTNPTWIDSGANPGLRGERPATNRLSHGTAFTALPSFVSLCLSSDLYCPLGIIGAVPRAYEGMEEREMKIKK